MKEELVERFTTYVKIDTQSNEQIEATPSTDGQFILADLLVNELKEIGMEDVSVDEHAYVMATLPANTDKDIPTIGFLAHMDTATDFTGRNVNPQLIENYNGKDITLNEELNITLSTEKFPELSTYKGHTLITTDGTTLLGADNKAGITEIMTAMAYLINHPEIKHGEIRIAFTPDEEIGRGPHKFDVDRFNADYAYTVDGGPLGELQYESFNAADARITFTGNSVHPGTAKNKLVNAARIAAAFINKFPEQETPEHTEQLEGFYHLISMEGDVERAEVNYIIRDFDRDKFAERKSTVEKLVDQIRKEYKAVKVELKITDEYYNMREKIEPVKEVVDIAYQAMENLNIKPIVQPIRGGTDGSQLSYMGLPTPNIFTGGENFHGKYEYVSVDNMEKATQVIVEICELFAKQSDQ
ncbi:peptidase T [Virgibacillus halodenitrificans]|uniref:peptidase T n=1 Tax=Virgibacillus halodenitrificans TaxID=1482 RepID=UPI00045C56EB|nr:peptidase T [Virgibacillus halodenitrificans]MCG1027393.1 peptidase T [Virgibacillus halodenitrificans]MEC2159105.1 peptidase T [Virgibacillus halodenitrificans]CDQ37379.1 Peptidase T [Virgibacillus halodenitrificans]